MLYFRHAACLWISGGDQGGLDWAGNEVAMARLTVSVEFSANFCLIFLAKSLWE